ncbi:hypothetical protein PHLCEN_2v6854 [Hermanssonia centrifuga]|uniref:Tyr recombinase domain-containing protein n=1 Tax=Hermanssonia centrifuga TaxID=98765 RepID=A0A2R6NY64_9APHY|nr:hypothetical protein PHLCEN_2v6854 [Hermanssonia centrifuga]
MAGLYAASSVSNYYAAVKAWHIIHRLKWQINDLQVKKLIEAARRLAPPSSKRPPRNPFTIDLLAKVFKHLDPNVSLDAAVRACASSLLFGIARCGELTTKTLSSFDPASNITRANVRRVYNQHFGCEVTILHPPKTKGDPINGEDISWAAQPSGPINPETELENHLRVNNPRDGEHLFAFTRGSSRLPLAKKTFLNRLSKAAKAEGVPEPAGHSFRIGGTLEYLLLGLSFETVKVAGRWKSDAFLLYLRRHAQILAPHLQERTHLHTRFMNLTLAASANTVAEERFSSSSMLLPLGDNILESQLGLATEIQPDTSPEAHPAVVSLDITPPTIQVFPPVAVTPASDPPPIYVRPIAIPSRGPKDPSYWALTEANTPISPGVLLEVFHEDALVYEKHGKCYRGRVSGPWALSKSHVKFKVRADAARAEDAGLIVFVPYHQAGISWFLVILRFLFYPFLKGGPKGRPKNHIVQLSIV